MKLVLLRHAVTADTGVRLSGRLPDIPLSEEGVEMASIAGARLAREDVNALYSSPIQRCEETATIVGEALGLRPRTVGAFTEVDFGDWTGRLLGDLARLDAWRLLNEAPSRFTFPGGEALVDAQSRTVAAVERLDEAHRRHTIVVVTHNDIIRLVVAFYLGLSIDHFHRLESNPTSVSVVELPEGSGAPRVPMVNGGLS